MDDGRALLGVEIGEKLFGLHWHRVRVYGDARTPGPRMAAVPAQPLPDDEIERILVVTAHPDDVDFGSAGTIATWTDAGIEVVYCICTDGDAGGFDPEVPRDRDRRHPPGRADRGGQAGRRPRRALPRATPMARLVASLELRRDISRVIRQVRPQRMLVPSPVRNYERHRPQPSRPPGRRRGRSRRDLSRRPQPVRVSRASRRGGPRGLVGP